MSYPKHIGAYSDLVAILDQAIAQGGAKIDFVDRPSKTRWRSRAYTFRTLYRKTLRPGMVCKYDAIQIVDDPDVPNGLIIRFVRPNEGMLTISPLTPAPGKLTPEEKAAMEFIDELKGMK